MAITSLSFFHFVETHEQPIDALRKELEAQRKDVAGSLIVLPEAFNIGSYWRARKESDYDPTILEDLEVIAAEYQCVLVCGLTITEVTGPQSPELPFTSVYLIDGKSEATLLCRKFCNDQTKNYTPSEGRTDFLETVEVDGMVIGALICMDACLGVPTVMDRQDQIRSGINTRCHLHKVVCIPARMGSYSSRPIADRWRNETVIFANGASSLDAPSFISVNGTIVEETSTQTNQLRIHKIPPWPADDNRC
jgi:predicted amidohydrolase